MIGQSHPDPRIRDGSPGLLVSRLRAKLYDQLGSPGVQSALASCTLLRRSTSTSGKALLPYAMNTLHCWLAGLHTQQLVPLLNLTAHHNMAKPTDAITCQWRYAPSADTSKHSQAGMTPILNEQA